MAHETDPADNDEQQRDGEDDGDDPDDAMSAREAGDRDGKVETGDHRARHDGPAPDAPRRVVGTLRRVAGADASHHLGVERRRQRAQRCGAADDGRLGRWHPAIVPAAVSRWVAAGSLISSAALAQW